jgi:hypothetical protein
LGAGPKPSPKATCPTSSPSSWHGGSPPWSGKAQLALKRLVDIGAIIRRQVEGRRRIYLSESFIDRVLEKAHNCKTAPTAGRAPRRAPHYVRPAGGVHTGDTKHQRRRRNDHGNGMTAREMIEAEDTVSKTRH